MKWWRDHCSIQGEIWVQGMVWDRGVPSKVTFATVVTDAQMGLKKPREEWQAEERLEKLQQLTAGLYLWSLRVTKGRWGRQSGPASRKPRRENIPKGVGNCQVGWGLKRSIGLISWEISQKIYCVLLCFPFNSSFALIIDSQIIAYMCREVPWTII